MALAEADSEQSFRRPNEAFLFYRFSLQTKCRISTEASLSSVAALVLVLQPPSCRMERILDVVAVRANRSCGVRPSRPFLASGTECFLRVRRSMATQANRL